MGRRRQACKRKMRHRSEETARDHRARLIAAGADGTNLQVYECECGGWHVGHRPGMQGGRRK